MPVKMLSKAAAEAQYQGRTLSTIEIIAILRMHIRNNNKLPIPDDLTTYVIEDYCNDPEQYSKDVRDIGLLVCSIVDLEREADEFTDNEIINGAMFALESCIVENTFVTENNMKLLILGFTAPVDDWMFSSKFTWHGNEIRMNSKQVNRIRFMLADLKKELIKVLAETANAAEE